LFGLLVWAKCQQCVLLVCDTAVCDTVCERLCVCVSLWGLLCKIC
jgi:hypothetical protein